MRSKFQGGHGTADEVDAFVKHGTLLGVEFVFENLLDAFGAEFDGHAEADVVQAVLALQVGGCG